MNKKLIENLLKEEKTYIFPNDLDVFIKNLKSKGYNSIKDISDAEFRKVGQADWKISFNTIKDYIKKSGKF